MPFTPQSNAILPFSYKQQQVFVPLSTPSLGRETPVSWSGDNRITAERRAYHSHETAQMSVQKQEYKGCKEER